jgi:hypothetical protein
MMRVRDDAAELMAAGLERIRREAEVPEAFPPEVL